MKLSLDTTYKIPRFNGYELLITSTMSCKDSYLIHLEKEDIKGYFAVRSWKNFRKYPNGYYLPYIHYSNSTNRFSYYYELSDINNKRIRMTIAELCDLIRNHKEYNVTGHQNPIGSRNRVLGQTGKHTITISDAMSGLIKQEEDK